MANTPLSEVEEFQLFKQLMLDYFVKVSKENETLRKTVARLMKRNEIFINFINELDSDSIVDSCNICLVDISVYNLAHSHQCTTQKFKVCNSCIGINTVCPVCPVCGTQML